MIPDFLTDKQREIVEFYQGLNVPAQWYYSKQADDGWVDIVVVGHDLDFVWTIHIPADGEYHRAHEAKLPDLEFETGISV